MPGTFAEAFAQILRMDDAKVRAIWELLPRDSSPSTPEEQWQRVKQAGDRIKAFIDSR